MGHIRHNLEIKIRYANLDAARSVLAELPAVRAGVETQTDTYFHVARGRLKLREGAGGGAVLIYYERPDLASARQSDYFLVPVAAPEAMMALLTTALAVRGQVRKRREIFFWHNVRIHLDEVDDLGWFLELEAVLGPEAGEAVSRQRLEQLQVALALAPEDFLGQGYADLLGLRV